MALSTYELTVPTFIRGVVVLSGYLEKDEGFAHGQGLDTDELIEARPAPDMFTFARQIQSASDKARFGVARLAAIECPRLAHTETAFEDLEERIAQTIVFLRSVDPKRLDGSDAGTIELNSRRTYRGDEYPLTMLVPDFFFHVATAHGPLRHPGVPVGRANYLRRGAGP
jgi:hypothetical protein